MGSEEGKERLGPVGLGIFQESQLTPREQQNHRESLIKQLLGPTRCVSNSAKMGWIAACKCFKTSAPGDSYPWEVQEMEAPQPELRLLTALLLGQVICHCPSLGLSLPICIMSGSDSMSANSTLRDSQMSMDSWVVCTLTLRPLPLSRAFGSGHEVPGTQKLGNHELNTALHTSKAFLSETADQISMWFTTPEW